MEPVTRNEIFLAAAAGEQLTLPEPVTRKEMFLAKAAGMAVEPPDPVTREEMFLSRIGGSAGGGEKILYMDAALLNEGGPYPADADDYTMAVIPAEATYVSLDVFDNLPNVRKVEIYGNCEFEIFSEYDSSAKSYVSYNVFTYNGQITDIKICGRISLHDKFAYKYYPLSKIDISCENLGVEPFLKCTGLVDAYIHAYTIPAYAFNSNDYLKTVKLNGVTAIESYAFEYCKRLRSVEIPPTVKRIAASAFAYCTKLTNVDIPDGVTYIGGNAFTGCTNLETLTIPASVTEIGSSGGGSLCPSTTVIRGYAGSYAEEWATANSRTFEVIE